MPFTIPQGPELLVILVIVLLVFGAGRVKGVMSGLGQGINEFRKGVRGDPEEEK